jgi:hypothetical protein
MKMAPGRCGFGGMHRQVRFSILFCFSRKQVSPQGSFSILFRAGTLHLMKALSLMQTTQPPTSWPQRSRNGITNRRSSYRTVRREWMAQNERQQEQPGVQKNGNKTRKQQPTTSDRVTHIIYIVTDRLKMNQILSTVGFAQSDAADKLRWRSST